MIREDRDRIQSIDGRSRLENSEPVDIVHAHPLSLIDRRRTEIKADRYAAILQMTF